MKKETITRWEQSAMPAIKHILVAVDWSEPSMCAFDLAGSLATDHNAQLDVLYVLPLAITIYGPPSEGYLQRVHNDLLCLRTTDPRVPVEYLIAEGDPATLILRTAEETHCDVIVMGTHGRTGLNRFVLGSVAEAVLRKARCPVLTVKCRNCWEPPEPMPHVLAAEKSGHAACRNSEPSHPLREK